MPRKPEDFGDGGAFPEIHIAQYPLGMGKKESSSSSTTLALTVDAQGKVQYDALLRQGKGDGKIVYSSLKDIMPVDVNADQERRTLPDEEKVKETTEKTKAALEAIVQGKVASSQPTYVPKVNTNATFVRYTPADQNEAHNAGASQRIIRMVEMQRDPMEPPRFKINQKLPRGPPSPPAPVMHSPPRKVTAEEQTEWKIPPVISSWKNQRGFTIPLDKRLAADGRGLQDVQINDQFAKLSEALYIAERKSREAIEMRQQIDKVIKDKDRMRKEDALRALAQQAREERAGIRVAQDEVEEVAEREKIREDRRHDRERELRLQNASHETRSRLSRDANRDVSERIALGLPAPSGQGATFDSRLYNQSMGMSSGFDAADDTYNVYDKPMRADVGSSLYRPTRSKESFNEDEYEKLKSTDRFRADKGFSGTEASGPRAGPVQFEKKSEDLFGLGRFLDEAKGGDSREGDRKRGGDSKAGEEKRTRR